MLRSVLGYNSKKNIHNQEKELPQALVSLGLDSTNFFSPLKRTFKRKKMKTSRTDSNLWKLSTERKGSALTGLMTDGSSTIYSSQLNIRSNKAKTRKKLNPLISFLPKYIKNSSNSNSFSQPKKYPIGYIMEEIKTKIFLPIENNIQFNTDKTRNINKNVECLKTHLSTANEDLSKSMVTNQTLYKSTTNLSNYIQRTQLENNDIYKEINEIKVEKTKLLEERIQIERETLLQINEYDSIKNDIDFMRQNSVLLSEMSVNIQNDKKIITSALLIIQKRIFELKKLIDTYEKSSNFEENLALFLS